MGCTRRGACNPQIISNQTPPPPPPPSSAVKEDTAADIPRGTRVTLHLKPDATEFADAMRLQVGGWVIGEHASSNQSLT